jgi:hypothetical protein
VSGPQTDKRLRAIAISVDSAFRNSRGADYSSETDPDNKRLRKIRTPEYTQTMANQCGIAKNTTYANAYLNSCDSVIQIIVVTEEWIVFSFNESTEASTLPGRDVWFSGSFAPVEGKMVLNRFLAMSGDETIS